MEDEAAWLLERVRVGDLEQERLELATHLGHQAALRLKGDALPSDPGFEQWFRRIGRWGRAEIVRALLACLFVDPKATIDHEGLQVVRETEEWVLCPCDRCEARVRVALEATPYVKWGVREVSLQEAALGFLAEALSARAFKNRSLLALSRLLACLANAQLSTLVFSKKQGEGEERQSRARRQVEAIVTTAIRVELVPWALGYGDPIQMRVAKRAAERGEVEILPEDLNR